MKLLYGEDNNKELELQLNYFNFKLIRTLIIVFII
jgi:hypothetical protein